MSRAIRRKISWAALPAVLAVSLAACATGDGDAIPFVVRLSAEGVLREAWSLARVRVESQAEETYGVFGHEMCGYRVGATVIEVIKGPSSSITLLTRDPLEPGKQYLVASRRIEKESVGLDPPPFIECRVRHELHGNWSALVERFGDSLYLVDPRGEIVPPRTHPEAPDRPPVPWSVASFVIGRVLETEGIYTPLESSSESAGRREQPPNKALQPTPNR